MNNKNDYFRPAEVTFTHIFFSHEIRGKKDARTQAEETLQSLNTDRVPFHRSPEYGDRFLYHTNYANRQADEIASHFGTALQRQLFQLDADDQTWKGRSLPFTASTWLWLCRKNSALACIAGNQRQTY